MSLDGHQIKDTNKSDLDLELIRYRGKKHLFCIRFRICLKGTGHFFENLSVGSVPGTDHSYAFFDEQPFSGRKMHLYACASVVFFVSVDLSTLAQL